MVRNILIVASAFAASLTLGAFVYRFELAHSPKQPPSSMGNTAPEPRFGFSMHAQPRPLKRLQFVDGDQRSASLADFRGKLVLLNLWATWCVPCRREMPTLDRLQLNLGGPRFEVVALSIDQGGVSAVKDFYRQLGLKALRIFVDPSGIAPVHLNVVGVPTTLLIDPHGREIGRWVGPAQWDSPDMIATLRAQLNAPAAYVGRTAER